MWIDVQNNPNNRIKQAVCSSAIFYCKLSILICLSEEAPDSTLSSESTPYEWHSSLHTSVSIVSHFCKEFTSSIKWKHVITEFFRPHLNIKFYRSQNRLWGRRGAVFTVGYSTYFESLATHFRSLQMGYFSTIPNTCSRHSLNLSIFESSMNYNEAWFFKFYDCLKNFKQQCIISL